MARKQRPLYSVVIDSREQQRYRFGHPHRRELGDGGAIIYGLAEGDYAAMLDGILLPCRIERKSLGDLFGVVGYGRERFEAELERLRPYRSFLIIEATADQVRAGYERSKISGEAAWASVIHWSVLFNITPIFAGSYRTGNAACARILEEVAVHHEEIKIQDSTEAGDKAVTGPSAQEAKTDSDQQG